METARPHVSAIPEWTPVSQADEARRAAASLPARRFPFHVARFPLSLLFLFFFFFFFFVLPSCGSIVWVRCACLWYEEEEEKASASVAPMLLPHQQGVRGHPKGEDRYCRTMGLGSSTSQYGHTRRRKRRTKAKASGRLANEKKCQASGRRWYVRMRKGSRRWGREKAAFPPPKGPAWSMKGWQKRSREGAGAESGRKGEMGSGRERCYRY